LRWYLVILIGIALASVPLGGAANGPQSLTFTVDSTADIADAKPGDGICKASNGKCTLRAAFNEVSTMKSKGQPVVIALKDEKYNLNLDPPAAATLDENGGDLDLFAHDTPPPSVTVTGKGKGNTVITQLKNDRVLELSAPEPVSIDGVTLTGGGTVNQGGGIANSEVGGLTITNSEVTGNSADEGGGIYSRRPLTMDNSSITDNRANNAGGGLAMNTFGGKLTSTTIAGNTAGLLGGGIWMQNTDLSQISRSLIMGNTAVSTAVAGAPPAGGGMEVDTDPRFGATTVQLSYTTIQGNAAAGPGGGIFWQATGTLALDSSLVSLNTSESGAGISTGPGPSTAAIGTIQLTNTTIAGNAAERGGGIERSTGNTLLRAVTIAGNSALRGSGILFLGARSVYSIASGLIMANLPASQNCALSTGNGALPATDTLSVPGANLETGTGCHLRTSDMSDTNPLLAPLANNGGPTQTRALLPGSPAVDRYTGADCPSTDQRAYKRPAGQACDIGAFEQSSTRTTDVNSSPLALQAVIGGTLTLIPSGTPSKLLRGVDFRPCTGKRHLNQAIAGGFFESPEGRIAARGSFSFRRDRNHFVRFGNLMLVLDGTVGHVLATVAPTNGALNLFDATGVRYGDEIATGRMFLTAGGARLLNRLLGLRGFAGGMSCGRFSLHARTVQPAGAPPKPPGGTTTTGGGGTKPPTTTTTPAPPPGSTLTVDVRVFDSKGNRISANGGTVKSERAGIACPTACTFTFAPGEGITLTETPGENTATFPKGFKFDGWDGQCQPAGTNNTCSITMDHSWLVVAKFSPK
jgi:CSLREA domain-containing protein